MNEQTIYVCKYEPFDDKPDPDGTILSITEKIPQDIDDDWYDNQARLVIRALKKLPQGIMIRVAVYLMQDYCNTVVGYLHVSLDTETMEEKSEE